MFSAQWAKVKLKGHVTKQKAHSMSSMVSFFDKWYDFYVSLNGSELYFFESKSSSDCELQIPVSSFIEIHLEKAFSTKKSVAGKHVAEDNHILILKTGSDHEVSFRYVLFRKSKSSQLFLYLFSLYVSFLNHTQFF